ncbi:hypothetical protein Plhal304r1_c067g0154741 [Plasmopara halstedii]
MCNCRQTQSARGDIKVAEFGYDICDSREENIKKLLSYAVGFHNLEIVFSFSTWIRGLIQSRYVAVLMP